MITLEQSEQSMQHFFAKKIQAYSARCPIATNDTDESTE
jgi:hypothetical protein